LIVQAFAKEWLSRNMDSKKGNGEATICMTGSMSAYIANMGIEAVAYNASKAAVNSLARNLAMEWGRKGIRINVGPLSLEMIELIYLLLIDAFSGLRES